MLLHYEEYKEVNAQYAKNLNRFEKMEKYLHEMSAQEIYSTLEDYYSSSVIKSSVADYLKWLNKIYSVDVVKLNFETQSPVERNPRDVYFYSLEEMLKAFEKEITINEILQDNDVLRVVLILNWYKCTNEEILSIKLTDVKSDTVYIPLTNRTIKLDNLSAEIVNEYASKDGRYVNRRKSKSSIRMNNDSSDFLFMLYKQNTLIRTVINRPISMGTISKLLLELSDKRFKFSRVYVSGVMYSILKMEEADKTIYTQKSPQIIEASQKYKGFTFANFSYYKKGL